MVVYFYPFIYNVVDTIFRIGPLRGTQSTLRYEDERGYRKSYSEIV